MNNIIKSIILSSTILFLSSCGQSEDVKNEVSNINEGTGEFSDSNISGYDTTDSSVLENSDSGVDIDTSAMSDEEYAKFQASRFVDTANLLASKTKKDDIKDSLDNLAIQIASESAIVSYADGVFTSENGIKYSIILEKDKAKLGNIIS